MVKKGGKVSISGGSIQKSGDTTNDGQSNFYGLNAAVTSDGGKITISGTTITTDGDGANAVFSTGESSEISVKNISISTKKNSSRGLDATYGGKITAQNVSVTTEGEHCAAFATDRGEGTVSVTGGTVETRGKGSPVIYSTGNISVTNVTGIAKSSEIACIEGKNEITITKSTLTGGSGLSGETECAIMLYQSMSGDANVGTAVFSSRDSRLTNTARGPFFYVTNTKARVNLDSTEIRNPGGILAQISGNNSERGWGRAGANGGTLELNATNQSIEGYIVVDSISSLSLSLGKKSSFRGALNASDGGTVDVTLDKSASFELTGDAYVRIFRDGDTSFGNVKTNGHTIFYDTNRAENSSLGGRTITLPDGGKFVPVTYETKTAAQDSGSKTGTEHGAKVGGAPGGRGDMTTISGMLSVSPTKSGVFVLTDSDGKTTEVRVMDAPGGGKHMGKQGGMPPEPPSGGFHGGNGGKGSSSSAGGFMGGNPPAPPSGGKGGQMQKPISSEELKKFVGTRVKLSGFSENDGSFVVLSAKAL